MRQRQLGSSAISVSVVGLGTMGVGGFFERQEAQDEDMIRRLQAGIDAGANLIDTAEIYGAGHSEELVGRAIQGRRAEVVIATKFSPEHSRGDEVQAAAERSLKRLGVDTIDLYQTHWPNPAVPFGETLEALGRLLQAGKVRTVGLSNATLRQWDLARQAIPPDRLVSFQQQYNLADRFVERTFLPICAQDRVTLIAYSPLLEGRIAPGDDRRGQLDRLAASMGISTGQMVLAWLLRNPEVIVIPKAARQAHLDENIAAAEISLPPEAAEAIDRLYVSQVVEVEPEAIEPADASGRNVYRTVEEARANAAKMTPSPQEIAEEFRAGEIFKPVKVRRVTTGPREFELVEGRLRYWGWVIAFQGKPVPCFVV